ncbi:DUF4157 domain-containing protein [Streptomyces sp. NPDC060000]|uniref:eCIS core domain-containing protein n=1 Tax=Streptomyces sp. NPDC060000 TaxID=3347031 RepID=UPI0036987E5D
MRAQEKSTDKSGDRGNHPRPLTARPATPAAALLALQRTAGNAAVSRAVQEQRHEHDAHCGHGPASVQRSAVHQVLRSPGRPLDPTLRSEMEGRFGGDDFSAVRVHTDAVAQRSATEIGAKAYTSGSHVVWDGQDKHTLAHELDHFRQQSRGPVPGSDDGSGLRMSDPSDWAERQAEETARRVMSGAAPVQRAVGASDGSTAPAGHTVQRKGHEELKGQIASSEPTPRTLASYFTKKPAPENPVTAPVTRAVAAYDSSTVRDPHTCMEQLNEILMDAMTRTEGAKDADVAYLNEVIRVVRTEMAVLGAQVARDSQLPPGAGLPYKDMTDQGTLWKDAEFAQGTVNFGMEGFSYVREMSELNRHDLGQEIGGRGEDAWVGDVRSKLENQLRASVVAHYTAKARAEAMMGADKSLKSKTALDRENPSDRHNTMNVDELVLANHGFVFFYIEHAGKSGRKSRFGAGKEGEGAGQARIELGIKESGLLSQGWIMLSDFIQRDYPKLMAHPDRPAETVHGKSGAGSEGLANVREFQQGQPSDDEMMDSVTAFGHIQDAEQRQAHAFARRSAYSDKGNQMVYGPEKIIKRPELLHKNILAGSDIIPGLVERAVVEIMRFEESNPRLANRLKAMSGADLMDYLFRDLLRPQAMIPDSVDLSAADITFTDGA